MRNPDGHLDFARCERGRRIPLLHPCAPATAGAHHRSVQTRTGRRWAPAFAGARANLDNEFTPQTPLAPHPRLARPRPAHPHHRRPPRHQAAPHADLRRRPRRLAAQRSLALRPRRPVARQRARQLRTPPPRVGAAEGHQPSRPYRRGTKRGPPFLVARRRRLARGRQRDPGAPANVGGDGRPLTRRLDAAHAARRLPRPQPCSAGQTRLAHQAPPDARRTSTRSAMVA